MKFCQLQTSGCRGGTNSDGGALVAAVCVTLLAAVSACPRSASVAGHLPEPLPVQTIAIDERSSYQIDRVFSGMVRSKRSSALGFERGGLVAEVLVEEGDTVATGDVIARLDTAQLEAGRRRLIAAVAEANAGVGISSITASRLKELAADEFIARQSADEATFELKAATARVEMLKASMRQLDVDLEKSSLRAPFRGIVAARWVDEGTVVAAGTPILRLLEDAPMEAVVGVPTSLPVAVGEVMDLDLNGTLLRARLAARGADTSFRTRTVDLIFDLPADLDATDGEVVRLHYTRIVDSLGFWVPTVSLTQGTRGLWTVYRVNVGDDGPVVVREEVEVLHSEAHRAFVRGTLQDGNVIVASGLHRVVPGQRVSLVNTGGDAAANTKGAP